MACRKTLRRVPGVSADVVQRFQHAGISTCREALALTGLEVMQITSLPYQKVLALINVLSEAICPAPVTALSLLALPRGEGRGEGLGGFVATSLPSLDSALRGGLPQGSVTEVAGPPGCGKTQFCIQLSVLATLPRQLGGLAGATVYIDTESAFSAQRLIEMARCRFPSYFADNDNLVRLTQSVHVYREDTCASLMKRLEVLEEVLITKGACLLVIDSIASLVRKEFDVSLPGNLAKRTVLLAAQAKILKYLAKNLHLSVLVTNQITSSPSLDSSALDVEYTDVPEAVDSVSAALGTAWCHCVNTRLLLDFVDDSVRELTIAKSAMAAVTSCFVATRDSGLEEVTSRNQSAKNPPRSHQLRPRR